VSADQARVTVAVRVPPEAAFEIFTAEIDRWWRRGLKFRQAGQKRGLIHLEPRVGGRLFEQFDVDGGSQVLEVGRVRIWDPPVKLAFSWRNANFAPEELTDVEAEFCATDTGTRVTVTHRGWSKLRADHPARHGLADREFIGIKARWWGEQLSALREYALGPRS
jgi:uncharacterized protein YndB with AHSA1/START domain